MSARKRDQETKIKDICQSCGTSAIDVSVSGNDTEDTGNNTYCTGIPYLNEEQKKRAAVFSKFPPKRSTIPEGVEYVLFDSDLPPCDNERVLPRSTGILFAEELYRSEQAAERLAAEEPPPFKKGFDRKHHEKHFIKTEESIRKPLSTASSFMIQLIFLIPVLNVMFALYFAFHKSTNANIKSLSRSFLIICFIFGAISLIYFMLSGSQFSIQY